MNPHQLANCRLCLIEHPARSTAFGDYNWVSEVVSECFFFCTTQATLVLFFFFVCRNSQAPQTNYNQRRSVKFTLDCRKNVTVYSDFTLWAKQGSQDVVMVREIQGKKEIPTKRNINEDPGRGMKKDTGSLTVSGWRRPKGKHTNRKSMKGIEENECVTKRKVMAIIGAIHHWTVLGVGVMSHPSTEPLALWVADDKTVWSHASQLTASTAA